MNAGGVFLFFLGFVVGRRAFRDFFFSSIIPLFPLASAGVSLSLSPPALLLEGRLIKDGNGPGSGDKVTHPPEPDFSSLSSPLNSGSSSAKVCWLEQFPVSSPCMAFLFCLWILFALLCEKRVQKLRFWLSFHCFLYPLI